MGKRTMVTVERLAAGGLGLARIDGRIAFLPGVLPGEELDVEILDAGGGRLRARPVAVITPHPDRREPPCPLFLVCGGCQLLHAAYHRQTAWKTAAALERLADEVEPELVPAPHPLFYRDRVRLHVSPVGGKNAVGFYGSGSRRLIPIRFCHQLHPDINRLLPALADWAASMPLMETARTLTVMAGPPGEGLLATLDMESPPRGRLREILEAGPGRPVLSGWTVRGNRPRNKTAPPGLTWLRLDDPPAIVTARAGVFTQVNREINRMLVQRVVEAARRNRAGSILDLYAGIGNFSLPLAAVSHQLLAVEENPNAAADARDNLLAGKAPHARISARRAEEAVAELADRGRRFDMVVLDPPRAGASGLAPALARLSPRVILYVSCHPATLIRDLAPLRSLGYALKRITALDMFPQTAHLELMAELG